MQCSTVTTTSKHAHTACTICRLARTRGDCPDLSLGSSGSDRLGSVGLVKLLLPDERHGAADRCVERLSRERRGAKNRSCSLTACVQVGHGWMAGLECVSCRVGFCKRHLRSTTGFTLSVKASWRNLYVDSIAPLCICCLSTDHRWLQKGGSIVVRCGRCRAVG